MAEVTVQCECGNELDENQLQASYSDITIIVGACESCMENRGDDEYNKGYTKGEEDAS